MATVKEICQGVGRRGARRYRVGRGAHGPLRGRRADRERHVRSGRRGDARRPMRRGRGAHREEPCAQEMGVLHVLGVGERVGSRARNRRGPCSLQTYPQHKETLRERKRSPTPGHRGRHHLQAHLEAAVLLGGPGGQALRRQRLQQGGDEGAAAQAGLQVARCARSTAGRSSTRRSPTSSPRR